MNIPVVDVIMFVCCAISLALYTISGFRKKISFKEVFETRIKKVLFTIMKLTFINVLFFIVSFEPPKGINQETDKRAIWFLLLIIGLMWFSENTINGFKESRKMEGYTKLDYVASAFLLFASFLLIFEIVLKLPFIIFN
jgi:hypothetical protein